MSIGSYKNFLLSKILVLLSLYLGACSTTPQLTNSKQLINQSVRTLTILKKRDDLETLPGQLKTAAGVAIFPSVYKAGFIAGAEGGNGILISRNEDGSWGYPAFYTLASGSWGLQFGGQKSGVIFVIRNRGAVKALIKDQGKVSLEMNVAAGKVGTGIEGSITTNLAADIIGFSDSKGLYTGVAIEGSALIRRSDLNQEYYRTRVTPTEIILENKVENRHADLLRRILEQ
jgi:lipid-binding SYLF domain-containing protein